ncbi:SmpA/OmlA family protein [Luteibacter rhizovicinus]|uniref:SmpA/OmlA family protein n=1 Tax=Luteibacter rhizovicinus TaxID=242606 RepID=A0A4R3YMC0_9GAMM|nr:outer membrane protein assembly factor BamE [Luteibacter rhizovicinus]TCV93352.1 SmpA/OmlA family protein [Luteibacter rhizovicinus]
MKRIIGTVALAIVATGCQTTGGRITQIDVGSSRDQVVETLGRPDSVRTVTDFEVLSYLDRHRTRMSVAHTDYSVVLKDGKVVQFGPGQVRRDGLHSVVIDPALR